MSAKHAAPSPALFFETVNAYQRTQALKGAIELDVFSQIGAGANTAAALAKKCGAAERGVRILCDYLTVVGFLTKKGTRYGLTPDSALFLDRKSPACMCSAIDFLLSPMLTDGFRDVAAIVRKGGTTLDEGGTVAPENPIWVKFAKAMVPMMALPAQQMAQLVLGKSREKIRVLDIAAGHGIFGIEFARANPNAEIVAQDWPNVLEVARENAKAAGVGKRHSLLPGSAFDVDYGSGYDIVLLTNFLHHFDEKTCVTLLKKVRAALKKGGKAVTLEFVPDETRVSPPGAATFSMMMLGTTPHGDAYTFSELKRMCQAAGFAKNTLHPLPPTLQQVVVSVK
jgi:ubiquinone/menaquinone biosynthesis C-methylase UbiE